MNPYEKTEKFLDLYKQLEKAGRKHFPDAPESAPIITRLSTLSILKEFKEDIEYCRVVRNFLVHTPRIKGMYPIQPSDDMIELLQTCIDRLKNPLMAMDFAVKYRNMFTATLDTKIAYITDYMNRYGFTHVPVLDSEQRLIGVFSDNAIYSYICKNGTIHIGEDTTLEEISEVLPVYTHSREYFAFMDTEVYLYEMASLFTIDARSMKKLAAVFFTKGGKSNEKIQGMMTPYSLLRDVLRAGNDVAEVNSIDFRI